MSGGPSFFEVQNELANRRLYVLEEKALLALAVAVFVGFSEPAVLVSLLNNGKCVPGDSC